MSGCSATRRPPTSRKGRTVFEFRKRRGVVDFVARGRLPVERSIVTEKRKAAISGVSAPGWTEIDRTVDSGACDILNANIAASCRRCLRLRGNAGKDAVMKISRNAGATRTVLPGWRTHHRQKVQFDLEDFLIPFWDLITRQSAQSAWAACVNEDVTLLT